MAKRSVVASVLVLATIVALAVMTLIYFERLKYLSSIVKNYQSDIDEVEMEDSALKLLNNLVFADWFYQKLSSTNVNESAYYLEYQNDTKTWVLKKNDVSFDDIREKIQRMYVTNYMYVISIHNPEDWKKVDFTIQKGTLLPDNIVFWNKANVTKFFDGLSSATITGRLTTNGGFADVNVTAPIYAHLRVFHYNDATSTIAYQDDVMLIAEDGSIYNVLQNLKRTENNSRYLIVIMQDAIQDSYTLRNWLKSNYGLYCQNPNTTATATWFNYQIKILMNKSVCMPTKASALGQKLTDTLTEFAYIPQAHILVTAYNGQDLSPFAYSLLLLYIYYNYHSRYNQYTTMKTISFKVFAKLKGNPKTYIGEENYTHYYTKEMMTQISLTYFKPRE